MPIYEYRCQDCSAEFEELISSSNADAGVTCRRCESGRVTRLLSAFAVHADSSGPVAEPGPCGGCGAPQRGMCGSD